MNTRLKTSDLSLLHVKRSKLQAAESQIRQFVDGLAEDAPNRPVLVEAVQSVFVFAQEEAGTAVCIAPGGLLLTCSHCLGIVVQARCTAWDGVRDLALLQIVAAERAEQASNLRIWSCAKIGTIMPKVSTRLLCVGHPGSEDLEHSRAGVATGYDVIHVSEGRYRGCDVGQDIQDNSEIGALMHDCWTYWGHSGAPLIERSTGLLVGLHSSWDDETGMRRGVALEAVIAFLAEQSSDDAKKSAGSSSDNAIVLE
ncbi:hypothetical protein AMS68_005824 [Peltaster fructicola]|uniref:Serine protease n=1 Tax=Peltaster fructicola TaxID=286661 RepID=A0A6H0XZX1_9PEZI|nr:hypothetical protein AMS68_005824 [Peltaster fructicola]